jgi:hypothetical protein
MLPQKKDSYSSNYILGTCIAAGFFIIIACGQSLWVPASRIENLYARSIVLALTDTASNFAAGTGCDRFLPEARNGFLRLTGLSSHVSWDTRYYNRRNARETAVTSPAVQVPEAVVPAEDSPSSIQKGSTVPAYDLPSQSPAIMNPAADPASVKLPVFEANRVHSSEHPLKVFMFGDSQVFSLGSGLSRLAGTDSPIEVEFLAIHSSGFIRGDYYNWPAKLSDTFRTAGYEGAVMMLGMNDYQSFWNNKGEIMKKHTPEWEAAYKDKCRTLIDLTLTFVPRLYWIGMPVVKNREYNASLAYIDSVQESLALEYSPDLLVRVPLQKTATGEVKSYADTIDRGGGKMLKLMGDDGAHFTVEGGQLAMAPLFDRFAGDYLFSEIPVANLPE